jgi:YfiH family protein
LSTVYKAENSQADLNLGFTPADDRETVERNRRLLAQAITGNVDTPLVTARQIHSDIVVRVDDPDARRSAPPEADGLLTRQPGFLLAIQTADCIPVLVADRKRRAVGAFHAGWRGTVKRIVESGVERMRVEFGSSPEDMVAAIGPGIGHCCYAVGDEVLSAFEAQFSYFEQIFVRAGSADAMQAASPDSAFVSAVPPSTGSGVHLNLVEANRRQLLAAGLQPDAIQIVGGCTSCQPDRFFSHRASHGDAGRMMAVIGIRA